MEKKVETTRRKARRKYEETYKDERKAATGQFNTRIPRKEFDEMCAFLKKHNIPKVYLIYTGYMTLKEQYEPHKPEQDKK